MRRLSNSSLRLLLTVIVISWSHFITAFTVIRQQSPALLARERPREKSGRAGCCSATSTCSLRMAGGFEWEDPGQAYDQGVENPFKNPELMKSSEGGGTEEGMKIDPGRLLGPRLAGTNVYFVGILGSGKSEVANNVARRMGTYNCLDTDDIIEKATGMKIREIFEAEGEESFRQVESQVLDSVHPYVRCVISTGDGLVCRTENWSKLQTGLVVWLDADPTSIVEGGLLDDTERALLLSQTTTEDKDDPLQALQGLLEERKDKYAQADVRIEVTEDMDTKACSDAVIRALHDFIDDNPPAWKLAKQKAQAEGMDWVQ